MTTIMTIINYNSLVCVNDDSKQVSSFLLKDTHLKYDQELFTNHKSTLRKLYVSKIMRNVKR